MQDQGLSRWQCSIAWERLKNKYEPVSAPSILKLEKQFRELSLKKGQDPEVWITELEDICVKLENMGSCITENQFMIHILNNLTSDYNLQLALMERRVGNADKPLTVEEVRGELNLRFERLNMKTSSNEEDEVLEEQALFSGQFKGNVEIVVKLVTSHSSARIVLLTMVEITETETEPEPEPEQFLLVLSQTGP
jgi:hypothetical protein